MLGGASVTNTTEWTKSVMDTRSFGVTKTKTFQQTINGPSADGLDHNSDLYFVWLNPIYSASISLNSSTFQWNDILYDTRDPYGLDIAYLYGSQVVNPSLLSAGAAQRFSRSWDPTKGGLNTQDYQTILARNPFAVNSNYDPTTPDPTTNQYRYQLVQNTPLNYFPPPPGSQANPTTTTLQYEHVNMNSAGITDGYSTTVEVKGDAGFLAKANTDLKSTSSMQLTHTVNNNNSLGESASVTITPASTGYQGTTAYGLFQDNVYGTFMYYPLAPGRPLYHQDVGNTATSNPDALHSGGTATVRASAQVNTPGPGHPPGWNYIGHCIWSGFGSGVISTGQVLTVDYSSSSSAPSGWYPTTVQINLSLDGGSTWSSVSTGTQAERATASIPAGTDLGKLQVSAQLTMGPIGGHTGSGSASLPITVMVTQ